MTFDNQSIGRRMGVESKWNRGCNHRITLGVLTRREPRQQILDGDDDDDDDVDEYMRGGGQYSRHFARRRFFRRAPCEFSTDSDTSEAGAAGPAPPCEDAGACGVRRGGTGSQPV